MPPPLRSGFRLGSFDVLPERHEIIDSDTTLRIQPKAMDVLCYLAAHAGAVVEHEAILHAVWEDDGVSEEALTHCIGELRHALGDTVSPSKYIQTIPGRGYRLVADIDAAPAAPAPSTAPRSFWAQVKERNVVRVGIAYAALAWLVIEVTETIFPYLHLPPWLNGFIVIVALIGFPIALALAWVFEITPSGIVVDRSGGNAAEDGGHTLAHAGTNRVRRLDAIAIGAALVAASIIGYQFVGTGADRRSPTASLGGKQDDVKRTRSRRSIAILPFDNLSGAADKDYFGDGLAEDLIHLLTQARQLRVSPRAASFFYKNKDVELETIAQRLQVGTMLTGSVRIRGDQIVVVVQLQDMETATTLWSERIEEPLGDVFKLQSKIARTVVERLKAELEADEPPQLAFRPPTEILGAYQYFAQAREYLRRPLDEAHIASAQALLERALELDAGYAEAYALMCETHLARYALSYYSDTQAFESAERNCFRAKTLDDSKTNVFVALGALYRHSGQYEKAIDELSAAITQSPFLVAAHIELGLTLDDKGEVEKAEQVLRRAIDMDPGYFESYRALGNLFYKEQRFADAAQYFEAVTKLTPTSKASYNNLAGAYFMMNEFEHASHAWQQSLALGATRSTYTNLGLSLYYSGRFADAVDMQRNAAEIAPTDHRVWGRLAESARFVDGLGDESDRAYRKAISFAQDRLRVNPRDWETLGLLALYQAHTDASDDALINLGKGLALAPTQADMHYFAALVYLELDNEDAALSRLQSALELGFSPRLVRADPDILPFLQQDRFQALLTP